MNAPEAPQARACANAIWGVLLRGNAANEIPVTPKRIAIGAAVAAARPGFAALYTNYRESLKLIFKKVKVKVGDVPGGCICKR